MDKRVNNGGKRKGAGRPPKTDEKKLIERLDNVIDKEEALNTLAKMIKKDFRALKLYMEYRYGKPKESLDVTSKGQSISFKDLVQFGNTES